MQNVKFPNTWDTKIIHEVSDEWVNQQRDAYKKIVKIAEKNSLISKAAGGCIVIVHPDIQLSEGVYHQVLYMTNNLSQIIKNN